MLTWRPRITPLAPAAVVARDAAARALAGRALARDDEALSQLKGVGAPGFLLLVGPGDALPWADGVAYLGRDERAPSLLLPTAEEPVTPLALLERAVLGRFPGLAPPIALLAAPPLVASASAARAVDRAQLRAW